MTDGSTDDLSSVGDQRQIRWAIGSVVLVAVVAIAVLATAGRTHHPRRRAGPRPTPTTAATTPAPVATVGSLLTAPLPSCTTTDHQTRLSIAFEITNLGRAPQRLVAVSSRDDGTSLQAVGRQVGRGGCGGATRLPLTLASGARAVVRFDYRVLGACPRRDVLSARLTFDVAAGGVSHATAQSIADLRFVRFAGC